MGDVLIITPVKAGKADALSQYLATLPRDGTSPPDGPAGAGRSPFSGALPPTHFARLVIVELHHRPHLLFSSRFDGPAREYLRALTATEQAVTIWGHCEDTRGAAFDRESLERYLCDRARWLRSQYVVSAIPSGLTVGQINAALTLRRQVSALAARAAGLDQWALAHEFRQLPAIRHLLHGS
jgi:hypothetical protein